ncbi:hypothetical protein QA648_35250 (plasmid) [Rhizobium sp. CB3171]|uniref:hypothetical protein n=1 Tax=Rhizobium sp. CB3171 TaxID=3039157 RepID=UPI0024B0E218|nr:hypothetical protein [Rhizobium sp. CB3171]WFU07165.1 hypothetical protein QA648_35250 [Rhizobium sp. CB3171]
MARRYLCGKRRAIGIDSQAAVFNVMASHAQQSSVKGSGVFLTEGIPHYLSFLIDLCGKLKILENAAFVN